MLFGKGDFDLPQRLAIMAKNARNLQDDGGDFPANGQGPKPSFFASLLPNIVRPAAGADDLAWAPGDVNLDPAGNDFLPQVGIATKRRVKCRPGFRTSNMSSAGRKGTGRCCGSRSASNAQTAGGHHFVKDRW